MIGQSPINPGALEAAAKELFLEEENTAYVAYPEWDSPENIGKESYIEIARAVVSAYLAAALPEVTSVEELEALPQNSVIRSVVFGVVRERFDSGWLATGGGGFDQSSDIAGRAHVVIYRPEVNDA